MTVRQHKRVLAYVNRLRAELGESPLDALPRGVCGKAEICPIANALPKPASVDVSGIYVYENDVWECVAEPPAYVVDWIRSFDDGRYPELIA
jgi:hypothetical protein